MTDMPQGPGMPSFPRPPVPPPFPMHGPAYSPFPPPPKRSRSGWLIGLGILVIVLLGFLGVIFIFSISGVETSALSLGKKIAVVNLDGVILESQDTVKNLVRYRKDDDIKAVVLRIDSPGGGVGASQEIYTEVKKLKEVKPVVVSMGSLAASGGYYVACPADKILANPGTITGSIGVIMQVTNVQGLLKWIKVDRETLKSGKFKDTLSPYRSLTNEERIYLQEFMDGVHAQFMRAVAEGRKMDLEKVRELADGRIYSGEQALDVGLVDQLGNLYDAIDVASKLAGIEGEPKIVWPMERRSPFLFGTLKQLFGQGPEGLSAAPFKVMYMLPGFIE